MNILSLNPGGNSIKVELVETAVSQTHAFQGVKLLSISIDNIGKKPMLTQKKPMLTQFDGKKILLEKPVEASDYQSATSAFFRWYATQSDNSYLRLRAIDCIGMRVVHGGEYFDKPARIDENVEEKIMQLEALAPLHNKNSIEMLNPIRKHLSGTPIYAVFDTAFHRTLPQYAYTYAIPIELAAKHGIRRYGFHGISHRYLLERYAYLANKPVNSCNIVTTHLESGCSVSAIQAGQSIDNTMGMTPLEGLMMGTRSGDIDPTVIALLMREEKMSMDEVMTMLNKQSGLLGISGESLDTRVLMKHYDTDARARLAMDLFAYRARKAVAAQLGALGDAEAIIFSGGIGEDTPFVRKQVCDGLRGFGLRMDEQANQDQINIEGRITTEDSRIAAWVILAEEGLQIAQECHGLMADA